MNNYFGEKLDGLKYEQRKCVYAVIFNQVMDKLLVVKNGKGHYFLPGGGIEVDESHHECLEREMLEETGYSVSIDDYIGNAKRYFLSSKNEPLLNDGHFYLCTLLEKIAYPIDDDHEIVWIEINEIDQYLFHEHHIWAIEKGIILKNLDK
ncbi:NUDIX hydrolase [Macrococcus animalis]|uniref:NUDIX hydrolase n=1 Tax=Macrococcus animalis TaxID=3395467 RepID=UPI0039BEAC1B